MAVLAELCALALWQLAKYSSRSEGCLPGPTNDSNWLILLTLYQCGKRSLNGELLSPICPSPDQFYPRSPQVDASFRHDYS